ncbi:MAG: AbgT family transporter [Phycisphaerae bacterium]|nr:AbgT family transporter [Phycisphaerae bacterium]
MTRTLVQTGATGSARVRRISRESAFLAARRHEALAPRLAFATGISGKSGHSGPATLLIPARSSLILRRVSQRSFLSVIERVGNRLPDPATLFLIGCGLVVLGSAAAAAAGWSLPHPTKANESIVAKSLLATDGVQWIFVNMVKNFTDFHPLGVVLVAMLGVGVAERSGLIAAILRLVAVITPSKLLTPAMVFLGVQSSMAADAGYVVLPPLAALIFARFGRSPLVGIAAVFAGVAGGFSANLLVTSLDPLLSGLTQQAAQLLKEDRQVLATSNWYFMIVSTLLLTLVGWFVTSRFIESRFSKADVDEQLAAGRASGALSDESHASLKPEEKRGLVAAFVVLLLGCAVFAYAIAVPGAPLHGDYPKPPRNLPAPVWGDSVVPMLLILFLLPGIAYGISTRAIKNDRAVAKMMGDTMSTMGSYLVLAFFASQFIAWFNWSNLGSLVALTGAEAVRDANVPKMALPFVLVLLAAFINLLVSSASAKWAMMAPVFVPMMMSLGIAPELTQAAYRVGDSVTNMITPLNAYLVIILVYMQRYAPKAGLGSIISMMLPYSLAFLVGWMVLLGLWMALDLPLGPGGAKMWE